MEKVTVGVSQKAFKYDNIFCWSCGVLKNTGAGGMVHTNAAYWSHCLLKDAVELEKV